MTEHPVLSTIRAMPRVALLHGSTPFEPWARTGRRLGIELYAKRDDLIGIGGGGNKLRKLELILGDALKNGATWLLTTGGVQSNHARLTAAAAARLGLGCTLHLRGDIRSENGNVLLDRLFGAEVRMLGGIEYPAVYEGMAAHADELRAAGHVPLSIPLGGATPLGVAAYVLAFAEILDDCERTGFKPDTIVLAAGTASTFAGLELAARLLAPDLSIVGISVSWTLQRLVQETEALLDGTCGLLGISGLGDRDLCFEPGFVGPGYAQISATGLQELKLVAREQGVLCDTTYTGKALAGLAGLCGTGRIREGARVVFLHTGGVPELFTHSKADLQI